MYDLEIYEYALERRAEGKKLKRIQSLILDKYDTLVSIPTISIWSNNKSQVHLPQTREERNAYQRRYYNLPTTKNKKYWRLLAIKRLGGICVKCGFSDVRALQLDHIKGGGTKEINSYSSITKYYKKIALDPIEEVKVKYQVLCANHNWIKRAENRELN